MTVSECFQWYCHVKTREIILATTKPKKIFVFTSLFFFFLYSIGMLFFFLTKKSTFSPEYRRKTKFGIGITSSNVSGVALKMKLLQEHALCCWMLGMELLSKPECSPVNWTTELLCDSAGAIESMSHGAFSAQKLFTSSKPLCQLLLGSMFPWFTASTVALGERILHLILGTIRCTQMKQAVANWISK